MIVRLTQRQFRAVEKTLSPVLSVYLFQQEQMVEGKMVEVAMIPDAWAAVLDEMAEHLQREQYVHSSSTHFAATKRIATEVNRRRQHPALKGAALLGRSVEYIPAWRHKDELLPFRTKKPPFMPQWSIYNSAQLVVLEPEHVTWKGEKLTKWHEIDSYPGNDPDFEVGSYNAFYALSKMS